MFVSFIVAFFSSFLVILGSSYSYKKMIATRVDGYSSSDNRDAIDNIEDPFDLYSDDEPTNLKEYIKEHKAQAKKESIKNSIKFGSATVSLYRVAPYIILVLGFIALKNNNNLYLITYMLGIFVGIVGGYILSRRIFYVER